MVVFSKRFMIHVILIVFKFGFGGELFLIIKIRNRGAFDRILDSDVMRLRHDLPPFSWRQLLWLLRYHLFAISWCYTLYRPVLLLCLWGGVNSDILNSLDSHDILVDSRRVSVILNIVAILERVPFLACQKYVNSLIQVFCCGPSLFWWFLIESEMITWYA